MKRMGAVTDDTIWANNRLTFANVGCSTHNRLAQMSSMASLSKSTLAVACSNKAGKDSAALCGATTVEVRRGLGQVENATRWDLL